MFSTLSRTETIILVTIIAFAHAFSLVNSKILLSGKESENKDVVNRG